jgi:hypothetical protein
MAHVLGAENARPLCLGGEGIAWRCSGFWGGVWLSAEFSQMLKAYDETARRLKELEATDHVIEYARLQQTIKG